MQRYAPPSKAIDLQNDRGGFRRKSRARAKVYVRALISKRQ
jgi:hypothetical protein